MRALILAFVMCVAFAAPARADDLSDAQATIRAQVEALGRDDAAAAHGYAAPAIQQMFSAPEDFMGMVRSGYAPVYRHKSFEFGEARVTDSGIAQRVRIVDTEGIPWDALYTLERQPDGSLKITGCVLLKVAGQAV